MRVFVAGAHGFVGHHIIDGLRADGHTVTDWTRADGPLPSFLTEYDIVYNCVGQLGKNGLPDRAYYAAHVDFLLDVLQRIDRKQPFVHMSSAYVTQPQQTSHRAYVESKLLAERIIHTVHPRHLIVRPGMLYGPGDHHHFPLFKAVVKLGRLCPIPGDAECCPTYVSDLVRELTTAPDKLVMNRTLTIAGQKVTIPVLMGLIARAAGVTQPRFRVPLMVKRDFFGKSHVFASDAYTETPLLQGLAATVAAYRRERAL